MWRGGGEFKAALRIEFLHGAEEANVAFLNQIEGNERTRPMYLLLGDGDDQTQVGLGQLLLGAGIHLF